MAAPASRLSPARRAGAAGVLALLLTIGVVTQAPAASSPFAAAVVAAQGPFGPSPYDDPASVLGMPSTNFYDPFGASSGGTMQRRVKLVEAAYNLDATQTSKLITTLQTGSYIVVRFDQPILRDPAHPYGIDLLVFGNALYTASGLVNDSTDMNTLMLAGGGLYEPMKVSVSPGYTGAPGQSPTNWQTWAWYRYDNGPYADTAFPTHAYHWNRTNSTWSNDLMDFTKPVNPALGTLLNSGDTVSLSAADAIDLYDGSGGGTGFDLAESGFASIQYVKVEGLPGFDGGEVDAFSNVRQMVLGDSLTIAPDNLTDAPATLRFQRPGSLAETALALAFTAVSDVARISTAPLPDPSALAPVSGQVLTAAGLDLSPVLAGNVVAFQTDLRLSAGPGYAGNGADLDLLLWQSTNWHRLAFAYESSSRTVATTGLTNLSSVALVQVLPPQLTISLKGNETQVRFTPIAGWLHTLERTTAFNGWSPVASATPTNGQPLALSDLNPPPDHAFYRVRLIRP